MDRRLSARRALAGLLAAAGMHAAYGALFQDVERDDASAVRRALDAGEITPDAKIGEPPIPILAVAARAGSVQVVRLLVSRKADLDAKTPTGETAVMLASAIPDAPAEAGIPPRQVQVEIVRVLVEAGASLSNPGYFTAVSYAAYAGHIEILRYLLDHKASPDGGATGDEYRYPTPLAMAVMKGDAEAVRLLLDRGANPRIKGPAGVDALGFARKFNRADLAPLIECALALGPGERFAERCDKR
jgi:ankyrin repeat protein